MITLAITPINPIARAGRCESGGGVVGGPGDDLLAVTEHLAVVEDEDRDPGVAAELRDLPAAARPVERRQSEPVDGLDLGVVSRFLQRVQGVAAGMTSRAARGADVLHEPVADVELHLILSLSLNLSLARA